MNFRAKVKSEVSLLSKSRRADLFEVEDFEQPTPNMKLPKLQSKTPMSTKADRLVLHSKFSNIPTNTVILLPAHISEKEGSLHHFARNVLDENNQGSKRNRTSTTLRKTANSKEVELLIEASKRHLGQMVKSKSVKTRGSVFASDFWTERQIQQVIKTTGLDKAYQEVRDLKREALTTKLERLERHYDKSHDETTTDINKIFSDFNSQGLNAPNLKLHRFVKSQVSRTSPALPTLPTHEYDDEILMTPVKEQELKLEEVEENTESNNRHDTRECRDISTENTSASYKLLPSESRYMLPGTLCSLKDLDNSDKKFSSISSLSRGLNTRSQTLLETEKTLESRFSVQQGYGTQENVTDKENRRTEIFESAEKVKVREIIQKSASSHRMENYNFDKVKKEYQAKFERPGMIYNTRFIDYKKGRKVWVVSQKVKGLQF